MNLPATRVSRPARSGDAYDSFPGLRREELCHLKVKTSNPGGVPCRQSRKTR